MAGGSKLQNLEDKKKVDEGKCLLCLKQPMDDKATIHCGHSFCFSCLKEAAEANNPNVLCPLCKTRFQVIWHQSCPLFFENWLVLGGAFSFPAWLDVNLHSSIQIVSSRGFSHVFYFIFLLCYLNLIFTLIIVSSLKMCSSRREKNNKNSFILGSSLGSLRTMHSRSVIEQK